GFCKLYRKTANTTCRAIDENLLARSHADDFGMEERLESRDPGNRNTSSLYEIEALRHSADAPRRSASEFRIASPCLLSGSGPKNHAIAFLEFADIPSRSLHHTCAIHAGDGRKGGGKARAGGVARAYLRVGWIDTRAANPDQNFVVMRLWD